MPYYLTKTNGDALATIEDGTLNNTTVDLALIGKNYPTYGLSINENFIKLLENFANVDQPAAPLRGQLWYDTTNKRLTFRREGSVTDIWEKVASITESSSQPTESRQGDLWWDTSSDQLKVYNGTAWIIIGPQTTSTGLIRIAGTNTFQVQIGGTNVFTADSAGRVAKPLQPMLQAQGLYTSTNFTTSNASTFGLWRPLSTIFDNTNGAFAAGQFTAPVAGKYRVYAHVMTLGSSGGGSHNIRWRLNGSDYNISASNSHTNALAMQLVASGLMNVAKGDIISLVASTDSLAYISYQNSAYSIELVA